MICQVGQPLEVWHYVWTVTLLMLQRLKIKWAVICIAIPPHYPMGARSSSPFNDEDVTDQKVASSKKAEFASKVGSLFQRV
jgi:hypothetical protein